MLPTSLKRRRERKELVVGLRRRLRKRKGWRGRGGEGESEKNRVNEDVKRKEECEVKCEVEHVVVVGFWIDKI